METKIAFVIEPNGNSKKLEFNNDNALKLFQQEVGGLIQPVAVGLGLEAYVNEEGLMKGLPINPMASALATEHFLEFLPAGEDYLLVGNAVFVGVVDEQGYSTSLTENQIIMLDTLAKIGALVYQVEKPF